jgi:hypothetical protein
MGDGRPNAGEDEQSPIQETALAAAKRVRVNIFEWAGSNGFDFTAGAVVLGRTSHSMDGHVNVMKWAETNNLGIFPNFHSKAHHVEKGGQVAVLGWLKDRSMLTTNNGNHARSLSHEVAINGHLQDLDWLLGNDFHHHTVSGLPSSQ